jgi:bifunctional enzyme CysN/CysC
MFHASSPSLTNILGNPCENDYPCCAGVDKKARSVLKGQRACVLWFTGLSGAGKSTISSLVERRLHAVGRHTYLLDGDHVRHGLNKDLGFTDADRMENIRRVAEVSKMMVDAGLIVLVAVISPFRSDREMARSLLDEGEFIEIYVDTPLQIAERRDPKGLYKRARQGEIANFTGIDSRYEAPEAPALHLSGADESSEALAGRVIALLHERGLVPPQ